MNAAVARAGLDRSVSRSRSWSGSGSWSVSRSRSRSRSVSRSRSGACWLSTAPDPWQHVEVWYGLHNWITGQ